MARPLRLCFENAVYHITARGNRRDNIFYSNRDKKSFLERMNETYEKYSFICYAYCLMDNHYHLFIKTLFANLSDGIHYLNASYANWFRVKYKLVGSIFQGRYKSILVDEQSYALVLSVYIHLNPIRAGIVKEIDEYRWSSFLDYIGARKATVKRLDTSFILSQFGGNLDQAQKRYKEFVLNSTEIENPLKDSFKGIAVGSDDFIDKIKERVKSIGKDREIKETKFIESLDKEEIIKMLSRHFMVERQDVLSKRRGNIYRQMALYFLKTHTSLSLREIGNLFDMDYTAVSYAVKRFEERFKKEKKLSKALNEIKNLIE
ncbi:MAG: helix-turn-helix domain-containing protein, partial [Candidatus Aminicenantales bacterium]